MARARLAGRGAQLQGAQGREVVAAIGEEPPKDDGVELVEGGGGGDDDPDVLFEAGPEPHDRAVPWSTCQYRNGVLGWAWTRRNAYR